MICNAAAALHLVQRRCEAGDECVVIGPAFRTSAAWRSPPAGAVTHGLRGPSTQLRSYAYAASIALGWVLERVTGNSLATQIEERFWSRIAMEQAASLAVHWLSTAFAAAGLSASLRDMAPFGAMIRRGGRWNRRQILPSAAVEAIVRGGDPVTLPTPTPTPTTRSGGRLLRRPVVAARMGQLTALGNTAKASTSIAGPIS